MEKIISLGIYMLIQKRDSQEWKENSKGYINRRRIAETMFTSLKRMF
jgi:hypothetical protein